MLNAREIFKRNASRRKRAGLRRRWTGRLAGAPALLLLSSGAALAHTPETIQETQEWWRHWTWAPLVLSNLALVALIYGRGLFNVWRRAGIGCGISRRQAVAFGSGWVVLFVALISPLDALSDALSSAHMVQHMLLLNVAAPLLVLGSPTLVLLWALPLRWRRGVGQCFQRTAGEQSAWYLLWQPLLLWSLYALALWIWHLPKLYEAALRNELFHDFQHLTFLVTAALFWRVLLDPVSRLRLSRGVAVIYLFTTSLHATVLGVFMALAPRVWYSEYVGRTEPWSLTPLQDQQLAGLIMWMPACMIYAVIAAVVFALWLQEPRGIPVEENPA